MKENQLKMFGIAVLLTLFAMACALGSSITPGNQAPDQAPPENTTQDQPAQDTAPQADMPEVAPPSADALRQWASSAQATSSYTEDNWSPAQATGAPNTPDCGDQATAWASATGTGLDTLTVYYDTPVHAQQVHIYETYHPDQVIKVELIDNLGLAHEVVTKPGADRSQDPCPYILSFEFDTTDYLVKGVAITVDQTILGTWNEIDAVELIGFSN